MESEEDCTIQLQLRHVRYKLGSVRKDARRQLFCHFMKSRNFRTEVLSKVLMDKNLFPSREDIFYFLKFAFKHHSLIIIQLLRVNNVNIHELIFENGYSALHYLAELDVSKERNFKAKGGSMKLIRLFVNDSEKSHIDEHGYSYFHGACMAGDVHTVRRFISEGIEVNFDSWKCSPLHIAAQYRQKDVVQLLLENGANPNQQDRKRSTPLHALAWMCLCDCCSHCTFCDYRKPVEAIVEMLVKKKANIEARNEHGDTPLQSAVCHFDFQLVKSLLKHGASLNSLNEERIFSQNFESIELKNYPLTWNIIEVMHLLQSAGYRLNFKTRLLMLKCWIKVRGNDTEHIIPFFDEEDEKEYHRHQAIVFHIYMHEKYGFYYKRDAVDYLRVQKEDLKWRVFQEDIDHEIIERIRNCRKQTTMLNEVKLNDDVSLYQLCKMNYSEGYSILKNMKDWQLHIPEGLEHCPMHLIVKRHVGNILIRRHLELFAADLFTTDDCQLDLPYLVSLKIAENMSDEDLLRLCEQIEEANLE